jgi:serine/threonine protein kinase
MSDSTHHPRKLPGTEHEGSTTALPQSDLNLNDKVQRAAHVFPGDAVDDAPTIISKGVKNTVRPEDSFAQTLRGRRLAHFDLIEPIGVGGMAAVIRATDTQLDRNVALKILPPEMASDPDNIRRFQQEARAAAKLDHENIARVYFFGEDQGLHFIAFEFVEGENLRLILERRGRLPVPEAVHYMLQIATGLAHAAERAVVHRDIKPSNIIIGPTGRAKLVDMGLARSLTPVGDVELTQSGVTLGTFDYISPEQALEPRSADVRSDIYSLGCTFYQMLTGQAPVPDGTAAKKLHHHQHINPIDPRQLNPAIPDDLAAILSRMMAKDPRDRYQKPEHLVQHLLQLAQKLGSASEATDGVLFVDTPLPAPPNLRPMLVAGVAALLLVTLVVLHGMSSWSPPRNGSGRSTKGQENIANVVTPPDRPKDAGKSGPEPVVVQPNPTVTDRKRVTVETASQFVEALTTGTGDIEIEIANDINFASLNGSDSATKAPQYVITNRNVTIKSKNRTLRFTYNASYANAKLVEIDGIVAWIPFTFSGGRVTIQNVRPEVDGTEASNLVIAPFMVRDGGDLRLQGCEFVQRKPPTTGWQADVIVAKAKVRAEACSFISVARARTPEAVAVLGAANVVLSHCAFGPHAALVHLRQGATNSADVRVNNCTAMLVDGAAFQVDEDVASCTLAANHSLFSRPILADEPAGDVYLIRQNGDATVSYEGHGNDYHNLTAFRARFSGASVKTEDWEEFRRTDKDSVVLDRSPWADRDPLASLEYGRLELAFRLDAKNPDLRYENGNKLVGVEVCTWGRSYEKLPPQEERTEIVVDPGYHGPSDARKKYYTRLEQAILDAKAGDVILIKKTGELGIEPIRLPEKSSLDVTIRPYVGFKPILTLGDTREKDVTFFRVNDGKLRFKEMEFHLKTRERNSRESQAIVGMVGLGHCEFEKCIVTMDAEGSEDASLAAVSLVEPSNVVMKMGTPAPRPMPEVFFTNCFVRGRGTLAAVRSSRPFDLRVDQSLVALFGSLCSIDGSTAKEPPTTAAQIQLNHVTAVVSGNLISLHTNKDTKDLAPLQAKVGDSIFSAAGGQPLVYFDGNVSEIPRRALTWEGRHNIYHNFKQMRDQARGSEDSMMAALDKEKWKREMGESDAAFDVIRFLTPPPVGDRSLVEALPSRFRVVAEGELDLKDAGADLSKLPHPSGKARATTAATPKDEYWRAGPSVPRCRVRVVRTLHRGTDVPARHSYLLLLRRLLFLLACGLLGRCLGRLRLGRTRLLAEDGVPAFGKLLGLGQPDTDDAHGCTPPRSRW